MFYSIASTPGFAHRDPYNGKFWTYWWRDNLWWVILVSILLITIISFVTYRIVKGKIDKKNASKHEVRYYGKTISIRHNHPFNPDAPTRGGYIFLGWYSDKELTKPWYKDSRVKRNMELYPSWEKEGD